LGGGVDESEDEDSMSEEKTGRAVGDGNSTEINAAAARFYTLGSGWGQILGMLGVPLAASALTGGVMLI
jgi:hypothetical protein